jgi:hypothetical protein
MKTASFGIRLFAAIFLTCNVFIFPGAGFAEQGRGTGAGRSLSGEEPLLQKFQGKYEGVVLAVRQGLLSPDVGSEADDLNLSLKKYLIQSRARIDTYKLEVTHYSGAKQDEALGNLMKETAERERALLTYIQRLDQIAGEAATGVKLELPEPKEEALQAPPPLPKQKEERETRPTVPPAMDEAEAKEETGVWVPRKARVKELDIEIEIAPEDLINEEQVAD